MQIKAVKAESWTYRMLSHWEDQSWTRAYTELTSSRIIIDVGQAQLLHLFSFRGCPGFKLDPSSGTRLIVPREVTSVDFSSTVEFCSSCKQRVIVNMWNRNELWIKGRIWGSDLVIVEWAPAKQSECPETSSSFPHRHFPGLLYERVKTWLGELQW